MLKKASGRTDISEVAEILRTLANENGWRGTISQLVDALAAFGADCPLTPARLAIWLRQKEHALWWNHKIAVKFSRNGRRRLVQLSLRDSNAMELRRHREVYGVPPGTDSTATHTFSAEGNVRS